MLALPALIESTNTSAPAEMAACVPDPDEAIKQAVHFVVSLVLNKGL